MSKPSATSPALSSDAFSNKPPVVPQKYCWPETTPNPTFKSWPLGGLAYSKKIDDRQRGFSLFSVACTGLQEISSLKPERRPKLKIRNAVMDVGADLRAIISPLSTLGDCLRRVCGIR